MTPFEQMQVSMKIIEDSIRQLHAKKHISFMDFLKEMHAVDYHGTDDAMPDSFDAWLSELPIDDMIDFAEAWGANFMK